MISIWKVKAAARFLKNFGWRSGQICSGIDDKTFVQNAFRALLRREATDDELKNDLMDLDQEGSRRLFIYKIANSKEFENRIIRSKRLHTERGIDLCFDLRDYAPYEPRIVFDVGANVGQTTRYFRSNLPQADIFSFEPVKQTFDELTHSTRGLDGIYCFDFALGAREENVQIFYQKDSGWNSIPKNIDQGLGSEVIKVRRFDDFVDERSLNHVDLLKIDTEGHELEVLKGAEKSLDRKQISFIFCEIGFHRHDKGHGYFFDLYKYLDSKDYQIYAFYETNNLWYIPDKKMDPRFGFCNVLFVDNDLVLTKEGPGYQRFLDSLRD
jgi:FkbM family methyltransferase